MREIEVFLLDLFLYRPSIDFRHVFDPSNSLIKQFLASRPCLVKPHHLLIVIMVVLIRHFSYYFKLLSTHTKKNSPINQSSALFTHPPHAIIHIIFKPNIIFLSVIIQIIVKVAMRRQKQVCLSAFVNERTEIPNKKLSLPSKNITIIDELNPYISSSTQSLDLHNNRLTSLKGIEQFTFLKELNISENKIQNCEELNKLKELSHLKKLYLSNNAFLNEPIPEGILDFILDKETDIEILSFEILSTLKDVQEREIKIIFLKNYIQKIDMHTELKNKKKVMHQKTVIETNEILNKIVPQFYTLIEDPKIINKIKREAIDKKKQSQETMEEALEVAKQQKEQKIDELVKNIVGLLHNNEQFKNSRSFLLQVNLNDNTITFSPERKREVSDYPLSLESQEFSPVKYIDMSKDDGSIEDISLNTKPFVTPANINTKKQQSKFHEQTMQMNSPKYMSPAKTDLDNLETTRKQSTFKTMSQKMKEHTQFKQNVQSQIKKIKERQSLLNSKISESQYIEPKQNQPKKKSFDMNKVKKNLSTTNNNFIKIIEEKDESQFNKSSIEQKDAIIRQDKQDPKEYPNIIAKKFQSGCSNQSSISYNDQLTPEAIQTIYFKNLAKTNPMFTLLHSPSNSLNHEEAAQLLESLKVDHKEKFIELIKEKFSNQQLMRENEQLRSEHSKQIQSIINNNKNVYNQYLTYKEQFEWIDQRQRSTQAKNEELGRLLKEIEASEKKKATALNILQTNYKKLKEAYAEKHQRMIFLEKAQEKEEIIRQKRQANVLKKYFKQINERAAKWNQVFKLSKKVVSNRQKLLLEWGMDSFIFNRHQQKAVSHQLKLHEQNILKESLNEWRFYKQLQKKEKAGIKWMTFKRSLEIMKLFKKNQAASKMKKLKNIWAARFLTDKLMKKSIKNWKTLRKEAKEKLMKSIYHSNYETNLKIFRELKQIVKDRKKYIDQIYQKRTDRLISQEFKRMVYIMRKEAAEIDEKYRKSIAQRQLLQRKAYFKDFTEHTHQNLTLKSKKNMLRKHLMLKNFNVFKKVQKKVKSRLSKLRTFFHRLDFGVIVRMMKREKASNDLNDLLMKRGKIYFLKSFREKGQKQLNFRKNEEKMALILAGKLQFSKLLFLKRLQVFKLKGKNYIKHRAIQQLSHQMQLNDQNTIDLIRSEKEEITRCEKEIHFLKAQVQGQSIREMALLREKDEMLLSISQSYEIMMELRKEVDAIRAEYGDQEQKYNALVTLYNQSVAALQKKERDYEWLYDSIREHKIK